MTKVYYDVTVRSAAKMLRDYAEMTANNSKNWDNYENICKDMLQAAINAGKIEKTS